MNQFIRDQSRITWIGVLVSILVSALFYAGTQPLSDPWAIFSSAVAGVAIQLAVGYLSIRWNHYPKALLTSLLALAILCFLPGGFLIMSIIAALLAAWFVKRLERSTLSWSIFLLVALYGLMVAEGGMVDMGDPFVDEKIRQLTLNPDTLFFSSMATMVKNYFHYSTGLHGLPWVHYHFLSASLYGLVAKLLSIEPHQVFGYTNYILFSPLLVTGLLRMVYLSVNETPKRWFLTHLIVIGGPLSLCYGYMGENHFISESYLMGLLLFTGGLTLVAQFIREKSLPITDCVLFLVYLPIVFAGKISVGFILFATAMIALTLTPGLAVPRRLISMVMVTAFGFLGYKISRTIPIPGLDAQFYWGWYREKMNGPSYPKFLFLQFPYFFFLMPAYFFLKKQNLLTRSLLTWILIVAAAACVGFASFNLTIDSSGYYFSNVLYFISLPFIALLFNFAPDSLHIKKLWARRKELSPLELQITFISYWFLISIFIFVVQIFPKRVAGVMKIKEQIVAHQVPEGHYHRLFKIVRADPDPKLMVYVPKTETKFWLNTDDTYAPWRIFQCVKIPFYIPILTGKPAVYGLPAPGEGCYTFHRGYESYAAESYTASTKDNYTDEELCLEVKKHGFHGFYRVENNNALKHLCPTDSKQ